MNTTELIDRYCDVWNEPDAEKRKAMLEPIWAAGATYTDPGVHAAGGGELLAHITKVREKRPGSRVLRTSLVDAHHGLARFAWHVVQADGSAVPEGLDLAVLSADGKRIERIIGFFGSLPREAG